MPLCDLKSKKDVVENALILLGWAATESSHGRSIAAIDEDRKVYKEIGTTALEGAKGYFERMEKEEAKVLKEAGKTANGSVKAVNA